MQKKSVLFFDLDGTLTDPALGITNSFKHALTHYGLEIPSYEKLCTFIGPPLVHTFQKEFGFSEEKANEGVIFYREYFAEKGLFENEVYDGIQEMLSALKDAGFRLLIATSKPEEYSIKIAKHFGLDKYFEKICGSNMDETRSKKSEVIEYALESIGITDTKTGTGVGEFSKSDVLMIGDREHDIIGAKENGIESCGVLFGYGSRAELEKAGADQIVENVTQLKDFLLQLK